MGDRFGERFWRETGTALLSYADRERARREMSGLPLDLSANAFLRLVIAEFSFCSKYGQKRSEDRCEEGCHFAGYYCRDVSNCISNRFPVSVRQYARALAWLVGDEAVDLEHLKAVLPFALAHRLAWKDEALSRGDRQEAARSRGPAPGPGGGRGHAPAVHGTGPGDQ